MIQTGSRSNKKVAILITFAIALFGLGAWNPSTSFANDFQFNGPTSGPVNQPSAAFTVTTGGGFNGNVGVKILGGGLDYTERLNFDAVDLSKSFTITPTTTGTVELIAPSGPGNPTGNTLLYNVTPATIDQSALSITANASMFVGTDQTISVTGGSGTGSLTVTSSTPSVCSLSGLVVTALATGTCSITATKVGDATYNSASTSTSITIAEVPAKLDQSALSITANSSMIVGSSQTISVTGGSGTGEVSVTSSTPSACSVTGLTVTAIAAGTCSITVAKAGDATYNSASTSTSITVSGVPALLDQSALSISASTAMIVGSSQTISVTGGSGTGSLTVTSSTPGACSVAGLTVTALAAGTCTVTAIKAGDATYNPASTSTSITISTSGGSGGTGGTGETGGTGGTGGTGDTGGTTGGTSTGGATPTTTLPAYPIAPTSFNYSGSSDSVYYFYVPSLTGNVLVTLAVPAATTNQPVQIAVTPLSSKEDVSAGLVIIDVTMRQVSDGTVISSLNKPVEIRYWTPYIGTIPSLKEPGVIWSPMPLVLTPQLPNPLDAAYYIYPDSTYSVFTRSLSEFSFTRVQDDLLIRNANKSLIVGQRINIAYSGGSGEGKINFISDDLNLCTVDQSGTVTAIAQGECNIYMIKESTDQYLAVVSNSVTFTVKESSQERFKRNSLRNWLIYEQVGQGYEVRVNLSANYANAEAELQLRTYIQGRLVYLKLADIKLDVNGDAIYKGEKALLDGTRIRLVMSGSNIKFGTAA